MSNDHSSQRIKDNIIIQEAIKLVEDGICVTFPVDGRSMLPFIIGGKESVILEKPSKPEMNPKEVPLFRTKSMKSSVR